MRANQGPFTDLPGPLVANRGRFSRDFFVLFDGKRLTRALAMNADSVLAGYLEKGYAWKADNITLGFAQN